MRDELDGLLLRRFSDAGSPLPTEPFVSELCTRLPAMPVAGFGADSFKRWSSVVLAALWFGISSPWRERFVATLAGGIAAAGFALWSALA